MRAHTLAGVGAVALLIGSLAACGGDSDDGDDGGGGADAAYGCTRGSWGPPTRVTALDPAGSYDLGSSTLEYNLYQTLVTVPAKSTEIVGDAAESCDYDDPQTLTCTLKEGLKFSNGDDLTSSDVKYSFERSIKIQDANGAAIYLLGSITDTAKDGTVTLNEGAIETPDDTTVVFHLDQPDTTFQYVLTYPGAAAIVERGRLPGRHEAGGRGDHRLRPLQAQPVQGGRAGRARDQRGVHRRERGPVPAGLRQVLLRAVGAQARRRERRGRRRVAQPQPDRHRRPEEQRRRHGRHGRGLRDPLLGVAGRARAAAKQLAIRQAVAQVFDRDAIAQDAYDGTVDPLYSIVPPGYAGQKDSFMETYGEPDVAKAKKILERRRHHRPRST